MEHLTKDDLVLFATNWQQLTDNVEGKNKHLKSCPECKHQLGKIEQILNSYRIQNKKQCSKYFSLLINHLKKDKRPKMTDDFEAHIDDCEICRQVYHLTKIASPIDDVTNLDIKIPKSLLKEVDLKVYAELEKLKFYPDVVKATKNVLNSMKENFPSVQISLLPTPELSGTRGKEKPDYYIFTHKGGKIQLQIGLANKDVKLHGIFKEQVFSNHSDIKGNVFFDNLPKDDYRVEVKGYKVSQIKTIL